MMSLIQHVLIDTLRPGLKPAFLRLAQRYFPLGLVFFVAIVMRHLVAANTDVSWLITVAEKVLDGGRLYVDIIETNPPASILLYLPFVALARGFAPPPAKAAPSAATHLAS
jgi:hypothetical protein